MFKPCVGLPVVDVNFTQAAYNKLQVEKSFQCVPSQSKNMKSTCDYGDNQVPLTPFRQKP